MRKFFINCNKATFVADKYIKEIIKLRTVIPYLLLAVIHGCTVNILNYIN
jgi:hypothetical protein